LTVDLGARGARARAWTSLRRAPVALAALLATAAARADNVEEFGLGPRAQGMAGAQTALATDMAAAYYNPGGLVFADRLALTLGFTHGSYHLQVDSQRGADLAERAERIPDLSAYVLGIASAVPFDTPDRFGIGLAVFLPSRGIVTLDATTDPTRPEWFRYGERHDRVHLVASAAVRATDWLSLGLGASIFVDGGGRTDTELTDVDLELRLTPDAGLVVGALATPLPWLTVGVTYRSEVSFKLDFPIRVAGNPLLDLEAITYFTPHQVQLGLAADVGDRLLLTFDLLWANWSAYDTPFLIVSGGGAVYQERQRFRDVFSPKLGVELVAAEWLLVRGGYAFRSTAVPDQDGRVTNLIGGDKHLFALGAGLLFDLPAGPAAGEQARSGGSVDLDLFVQLHWHPAVQARKDASDPVGDWEAQGVIVNVGVAATFRF